MVIDGVETYSLGTTPVDELVDLVDQAVSSGTGARRSAGRQLRVVVAGGVDIAVGDFNVGEVPVACGVVTDLCAVTVGVAILVCPSGAADKIRRRQVIFVGGEQRVDFLFDYRCETRIGDDANDFVAFIAPRE